jgi:dephospho-CoA kinase
MKNINSRRLWVAPQTSQLYLDWETSFLGTRKLPLIVGLTGPTLAGKSMVGQFLVTEYGFRYERMSDILTRRSIYRGIIPQHDRHHEEFEESPYWQLLGEIAINLRKQFGKTILARLMMEQIRYQLIHNDRFVVDSILHPEELKFFQSIGNFVVFGFKASAKLRAESASNWYFRRDSGLKFEFEKQQLKNIDRRDKFEQYEVANQNYDYDLWRPNIDYCLEFSNKAGLLITLTKQINEDSLFSPVKRFLDKRL